MKVTPRKTSRKTSRKRNFPIRRKRRNPSGGMGGTGAMLLSGVITAGSTVGTMFVSNFIVDGLKLGTGAGGPGQMRNIVRAGLTAAGIFLLPRFVGRDKAQAIVAGMLTALAIGVMKQSFGMDINGLGADNDDFDLLGANLTADDFLGEVDYPGAVGLIEGDGFNTSAQLDFAGLIEGVLRDESELLGESAADFEY